MSVPFLAVASVLGLFGAILACLEVGWRLGMRRRAEDPTTAFNGLGAMEGAVFGLMGLLVAFTFSGAAARFDGRRELIVKEANAIGTAYLRLDLLPSAAQPDMREALRQYTDARLAYYRAVPEAAAMRQEEARFLGLQGRIWSGAVAATRDLSTPAPATLLLASLNDMIDITTTRQGAQWTHPSPVVFWMLGMAVLAASVLAGWGMAASGRRSWVHVLGFGLLMTATVFVILDLEFPRLGFIRVDDFDALVVQVRAGMS